MTYDRHAQWHNENCQHILGPCPGCDCHCHKPKPHTVQGETFSKPSNEDIAKLLDDTIAMLYDIKTTDILLAGGDITKHLDVPDRLKRASNALHAQIKGRQ